MSMLLPEEAMDPPLTDEDIEAYFEWETLESQPPIPPDAPEHPHARVALWSVCDTGSAEWAMRKLAHATAEAEELREQAKVFHDQIDRWLVSELGPHKRRINFFTGQLEDYARWVREEEGRKTIKVPSGEITSRLNPARPEIPKEAEAEFIEWARGHAPATVKAKWSPVMAEVKRAVTFTEDGRAVYPDADGEVWSVPGVVQVPEEVTYTVKPARP